MRLCEIEGCEKTHKARGWCEMHYDRWKRHGDPHKVKFQRFTDPEKSFEHRTIPEPNSGCLLWLGTESRGYGYLRSGGKMVLAHRFAWERENGPIPEGLEIDHICQTPLCVELRHLRLSTRGQNVSHLKGARRNNALGVRNVTQRDNGTFQVKVQGTHFGTFQSIEDAEKVAGQKRQDLFKNFAGQG